MPSVTATPPRLSSPACEVCKQKDNLVRCSGCHAIFYCRTDHQASHQARHRSKCLMARMARSQLEREEDLIRKIPNGSRTAGDPFKTGVGQFWAITETRSYMRARFKFADGLLRDFAFVGGCADVVQMVLDHFLDMVRLSRDDNMGIRNMIPALFVRLGKDQEAYDFIKWYETSRNEYGDDWSNLKRPFLDVRNANVFESHDSTWSEAPLPALSHAVTVILLKLRILLDLKALQNTSRSLHGTLPPELIELIRGQLVGSVVSSHPGVLWGSSQDTTNRIKEIMNQIKDLYTSIKNYNPYFWPCLLDTPAVTIAARPSVFLPRSLEEAFLVLNYNYASWVETPGAIEMVRTLSELA
ncbi:hypothetical protein BGZ63DRAFT_415858 [Mariannaea sp. PMI_226]|nr:hypothetical protein BGZ63DRAFT_415858 [Mariannaea sp. PMI_226]